MRRPELCRLSQAVTFSYNFMQWLARQIEFLLLAKITHLWSYLSRLDLLLRLDKQATLVCWWLNNGETRFCEFSFTLLIVLLYMLVRPNYTHICTAVDWKHWHLCLGMHVSVIFKVNRSVIFVMKFIVGAFTKAKIFRLLHHQNRFTYCLFLSKLMVNLS